MLFTYHVFKLWKNNKREYQFFIHIYDMAFWLVITIIIENVWTIRNEENNVFLLILNEWGTEQIPIYTKETRNWVDS